MNMYTHISTVAERQMFVVVNRSYAHTIKTKDIFFMCHVYIVYIMCHVYIMHVIFSFGSLTDFSFSFFVLVMQNGKRLTQQYTKKEVSDKIIIKGTKLTVQVGKYKSSIFDTDECSSESNLHIYYLLSEVNRMSKEKTAIFSIETTKTQIRK